MMLQPIYQKKGPARAFSIYCQWIRRQQREASPLIDVWMDSKMRGFEKEFAGNLDGQLLQEEAPEDPGGAYSLQKLKQTATIESAPRLS